MKTAAETVYSHDSPNHSVKSASDTVKDPLSAANFVTVIEHLHDIMQALREIYPEKDWHIKWQKLTRRCINFFSSGSNVSNYFKLDLICIIMLII